MPNVTRENTTGASTPRDFPVAIFDRINQRVAAIPGRSDPIWEQFATAWNAVAYRFLAAARADARFINAIRRGDRVRQELDLFSFVSTACSSIECLSYAIHAVGAILSASDFPITTEPDRKSVHLESTARRLEARYPGDRLPALMARVRVDPEWRQLVDWRDIEIHRGTPSRQIHLSGGGTTSRPDIWRIGSHRGVDVPLGIQITHGKQRWLARTHQELLTEVDAFLSRRAVP